MDDRKGVGLAAKPGAFEDLSDIKFHSLAELRQRGREVAEGTREATGMLDVAGYLEFRREERWAAARALDRGSERLRLARKLIKQIRGEA